MNILHARLLLGIAAAAVFLWAALGIGRAAEPEGTPWRDMSLEIGEWLAAKEQGEISTSAPSAATGETVLPAAADADKTSAETSALPPHSEPSPGSPIVQEPSAQVLPAQDPPHPEPSGLLDLNRATLEQLDELPGIGPAKAQAIIDYRETNGPFRDAAELMNVKGIGAATFEKLRPLVHVSGAGP